MSTIAQAIATTTKLNIGTNPVEFENAAIKFGLVSTDQYTSASDEAVNAAAAFILTGYLLVKSISEGSFAVAMSEEGLKAYIAYLAANSGGMFVSPVELQTLDRKVKALNVW